MGLADILHLNDCAIALLADGQSRNAVRVLQIALRDLKLGLGLESPLLQNNPTSLLTRNDIWAVHLARNVDHEVTSPNNTFTIYNKAFCMDPLMNDPDEAALVVLFNFALSLHIQGLSEGRNIYFCKALKIYDMLGNMLQTRFLDERSGWKLLFLALWTNMGHIHAHYLRLNQVEECSNSIRNFLERCYDLPMEDILFFHHTVFHSDWCHFDQIAAAA